MSDCSRPAPLVFISPTLKGHVLSSFLSVTSEVHEELKPGFGLFGAPSAREVVCFVLAFIMVWGKFPFAKLWALLASCSSDSNKAR